MYIENCNYDGRYENMPRGNVFSNSHKNELDSSYLMSDLDNIVVRNGKIIGILEDKTSYGTKILKTEDAQRNALFRICEMSNIRLFLKIEKSDKYLVYDKYQNRFILMNNKLENFEIINTDDKIYIEYRYINNNVKILSLMYRTNEFDYSNLRSNFEFKIAKNISEISYLDLYLVDDVSTIGEIHIKLIRKKEGEITKNSEVHTIYLCGETNYIDIYNKLNL